MICQWLMCQIVVECNRMAYFQYVVWWFPNFAFYRCVSDFTHEIQLHYYSSTMFNISMIAVIDFPINDNNTVNKMYQRWCKHVDVIVNVFAMNGSGLETHLRKQLKFERCCDRLIGGMDCRWFKYWFKVKVIYFNMLCVSFIQIGTGCGWSKPWGRALTTPWTVSLNGPLSWQRAPIRERQASSDLVLSASASLISYRRSNSGLVVKLEVGSRVLSTLLRRTLHDVDMCVCVCVCVCIILKLLENLSATNPPFDFPLLF